MPKRTRAIPVNKIADEFSSGIAIERNSFEDMLAFDNGLLADFEQARQPHREDRHSFYLLESGTVQVEIDFQTYTIVAPSIIYMHPDQVHRILSLTNATVSSWGVDDGNLNPEYLNFLEDFRPAKPLILTEETFSIISQAVSLCIRLAEKKNDRLYHSLLKDSCNVLVALVVSQYLALVKPADRFSRSEIITKDFKKLLERHYTKLKSPAAYAQQLNISTPYLNECVKSTTGFSVSHHIQQRVILEAKRLLLHSNNSIKEIAAVLGFDDYPYFSRLFTKVTGMSTLAFRNKNLD